MRTAIEHYVHTPGVVARTGSGQRFDYYIHSAEKYVVILPRKMYYEE